MGKLLLSCTSSISVKLVETGVSSMLVCFMYLARALRLANSSGAMQIQSSHLPRSVGRVGLII